MLLRLFCLSPKRSQSTLPVREFRSKLSIKRKMESDVPTLKPEVHSRLSRHLRCLKRWTTSGQQKLPCSCKYSFGTSMSSRSKRKARPKNRAMVVLLE
jgi:hypothetical protein